MISRITLILCSVLLFSFSLEPTKINWLDLEEAQKLAKSEQRKVLVDVYTNWCGWCKRMDKTTFLDPQVVQYANENYYAIKLDAEAKGKIMFQGEETTAAQLARKFKVPGYPSYVFLDENFNHQKTVPGYKKSEEFLRILAKFNGD